MPGGFPKLLLELRPRAARRNKTARLASLLLCLGLVSAGELYADDTGPAAVAATPAPTLSTHLTDAQDLLLSGWLSPSAEAKSEANALYAETICDETENSVPTTLDGLRRVVALDPHFADAQVKEATLLLQSGQLQLALDQLKTAAAVNPDSVAIEATYGYAQRLNGQYDEAVRLCQDALGRDPTQSMAMDVLLEIAGDRDDLAGCVLRVEDVLQAGGSAVPASAWLTLARLYTEVARGDAHAPSGETQLRTLLPIYQQAAAKPPAEVETLTLLADTYRDLGRKRESLKTLKQAQLLDPSNVDVLLRCAETETDLGRKPEALKDYEEAYALNPGLTGLREMLGRLYLAQERFEDAARLLQEALAQSPHDPGVGIDLGIAYEGAHHPEQAQACFLQVFAANPCPPEAYLKLAVFQLARDQVKEAGSTLDAARKRFPESAKVLFYQAVQHRYEKNYDAALACLEQVRALASGSEAGALDSSYYLESALILNLAGKKDRIEAMLDEGLSKYPDNADLMNELAYFWADQGTHLPEALDLSRHAVEIDPESGPIQDTRGWVYFQMGDPKDALPYLQRAALLTNNDPVVLQHVGDTYLKLGLRSEAVATWRRALEKDPGNSDLANRIDAALAQAKNAHPRSAPAH